MADRDDVQATGLDVLEEIGRGGFAVVYRAHDPGFDRDVAVKVLQARLDSDGLARFQRECAAVGAISHHPHIVAVHRSGLTATGSAYLVMELLPGGSMALRVSSAGPLPWAAAAQHGVQLAGALETAHQAGVLHRDVKPENILFSAFDAPVLVDFGIAAVRGGYETRSSTITASLSHAAPEIVAGERATAASDVYSLASSLFFAMAGHAPFVQDSDETLVPLIARIAGTPPPDLRGHGVPEAVAAIVEAGLAKDPAQRPASALAFATALRAAAAASGAEIAAPVVPAAGAPAPVVAATVPQDPTSAVGRRREPQPQPPVEPAGSGTRRRGVVVVAAAAAGLAVMAGAWALTSGGGGGGGQPAVRAGATTSVSASPASKPSRSASARPTKGAASKPATSAPPAGGGVVPSGPGRVETRTGAPTSGSTSAAPPAVVAPSAPRSVLSGGVSVVTRSGDEPATVSVLVSWARSATGTSPTYCVRRTTMKGTSAYGAPQDAGCTTGTSRRVTVPAVSPADSWLRWEVRATNSAGASSWVAATAQVPYVVGGKIYDATQKLRAAGLRVAYDPAGNPPSSAQNYVVIDQSPSSGTRSGGTYVRVEFYEQQ